MKIAFKKTYILLFIVFLSINSFSSFAKSNTSSHITIDVTNNFIANCKIDGKTDDYPALKSIMSYINSTSTSATLIFPYTGSTMLLSDTIYITRSNVTFKINCDISFTKSVYNKDNSMNVIEVGYSRYSRTPISNIQIIGNDIEINGNGNHLSFIETSNTKPNYGDIIHFRRVTNGKISGIICNNAAENGIRIYMCQNIIVENCEIKNTRIDNGLTVMGLPVYDENWYYNDDTCNNNVIVRNCSSHNNEDVGFFASLCRNVLFDTCVSYENGTATGFNAGGGFSHECLGFSTYYNEPNTWNGLTTFYNCNAYNNQNYGFYTDTNGTIINGCTIDTVIQNQSETYGRTIYGGNGIYALSSKGAVSIIDTTITNAESYAIVFSNSVPSIPSALNIENITITNTAKGIYCSNTDTIIINKANFKNIPIAPLNFLDGSPKQTIYLKNFNTSNVGKMLIGNAKNIIVDNSLEY